MSRETDALAQFSRVIHALRAPDGCPWDRKQTHESLKPYLLEESAEFLDAVDEHDSAHMKEELGDVLLQIMLHSVIAEEQKTFEFADVVEGITEKMIRRHPHVFGAEKAACAEEVVGLWEAVKRKERAESPAAFKSVLGHKPLHYPALRRVEEMTHKAAKFGFDWGNEADVWLKLQEELNELLEARGEADEAHIDEELGDILFVLVNLIRKRARASAEAVLHASIRKFERRFGYIEQALSARNQSLEAASLDEMEALWQEAKQAEKSGALK